MEREEMAMPVLDTAALLEEGLATEMKKRRRGAAFLTAAAVLLIAVSLAAHILLGAELFEVLREKGSGVLLSAVFPGIHENGVEKENTPKKEKVESDGVTEGVKEDTATDTLPYITCDLSTNAENAMALMNETGYAPSLGDLLQGEKPLPAAEELWKKYGRTAPLVLIYHTHGTEGYAECYEEGFRSRDTAKNVVAVGEKLAYELEGRGIGVIHLKEMFDAGGFNMAYDRSTEAVRSLMAEYPSLTYMIDVHRDYVDRDGEFVRCLTSDGEPFAAQVMLVCGTDEGGSGHSLWRENLTVALQLQSRLWQKAETLMRPVNLKSASFYQDTGAGAMIVEFGTCANTLSEAKASAALFAEALADYINE